MARIAGVDIPNAKRVEIALTYIYGIGPARAAKILEKTGISPDLRTDDLTEDDIRDAAIIITRCVTVLHTDHDKIIAWLNRKQRGFQ